MSIRANIAFRSSAQIDPQHLTTVSRVLYRQFGREAFHSSEDYIALLTPIRNPIVTRCLESDLCLAFAEDDFLYDVYTTRNYWSLDYMRGDFASQLDWMQALSIAFPTIAIFYYSGDAESTPWRPIPLGEIPELRTSYLHHAISQGIGYDAELQLAR